MFIEHTTNYFAERVVMRMDRKSAPEPGSAQVGRREDETGQGETDTWRHAGAIAADIVRRLDRAALLPHRAGPQAPEASVAKGLRGRQE
jgi:hypothetical protein